MTSDMQPHDIDALVREAHGTPTAATERWRATVARVLGTPGPEAGGRRQFLKLGGGAVLGAAVLAACGSDEEVPPSETGTTVSTVPTTLAPPQGTTPEEGATNDAVVTRTAVSLALAIAETYGILLAGPSESTDPDVLALPEAITYDDDLAELMAFLQARHQAHAEALSDLVTEAGGDPVTEANQGVLDGLLAPEIAGLTTQEAVARFAHQMEAVSAATHAWGAGVLTTPALRQGIMAVGAPVARQAALMALALDEDPAAAVPKAVLDTSGPARLPEHMLVKDGQDGGDVSADPEAAPAEGEEGAEEEGE